MIYIIILIKHKIQQRKKQRKKTTTSFENVLFISIIDKSSEM